MTHGYGRLLTFALVCSACVGVPTPQESDVRVAESALDQGCRNLTPVATFTGSINYTSPRTYSQSGCFKAQVVQVNPMSTGAGGSGGAPGTGGTGVVHGFAVAWADTPPSTESACTRASIGGYRFVLSPDGTYETAEFGTALGVWTSGGCIGPRVNFEGPSSLNPFVSTKFAVSARTAQTSGAATRMFNITGPYHAPP
jgi:hypothetical protein